MDLYPVLFDPIYVEKIWGGRDLARLFGRDLPGEKSIGESWELADLQEGTSVVRNGPEAGVSLTELTRRWGSGLLGSAAPLANGRFPLLLKLLDANDILSLQVHPDADAVAAIGPEAALKTECWYVVESRGGSVYKGVRDGTGAAEFRQAIETDTVDQYVRRIECDNGDFHFLPAGTVHALGAGLVVAEVQTPSDTTYRVTDWGRGRAVHVERSMQCIHFEVASDTAPGADGETLLVTEFFRVALRHAEQGDSALPVGECSALMMLAGEAAVRHNGPAEGQTPVRAGDTILLPAGLTAPRLASAGPARWLEVTLPTT